MTNALRSNQFSIAGLLFVMLGVGLFATTVPHLYAASKMTPPWSIFVLIVLMFSWCIIPLRTGANRAWWIGFLVLGSLGFGFAVLARIEDKVLRLGFNLGLDELTLVFGTLLASLLILVGLSMIGGLVFRITYRQLGLLYRNPAHASTTEPVDALESPIQSKPN